MHEAAAARAWDDEPPTLPACRRMAEVLKRKPRARVVVIGSSAPVWREVMLEVFPRLTVLTVDPGENAGIVHAHLAAMAPFDLIVEASGSAADEQVDLLFRTFFHLDVGGVYLAPRITADRGVGDEGVAEDIGPGDDLWGVIARAQASRLRVVTPQRLGTLRARDTVQLGRHLGRAQITGRVLDVTNQVRAFPKLTERELDALLPERPELGVEVLAEPPGSLVAENRYVHNLDEDRHFRPSMQAPRVALRRYLGPVCSYGQVVTSRELLLPDSFRHHLSARMENIYVEEIGARFGRVRRDISAPEHLPGAWFHLDSEWPGHFGHLLTEQVGRMWAWEEVRRREPDVRVLMSLPPDRDPRELHGFEREVLGAFGIEPQQVHVFDRPCQPEVLYAATPMFSLPEYVHPGIAGDVWDPLGDELARRATIRDWPRRIFCTRSSSLKRACHNTEAVEDLFRSHGFEIVRPETYSVADQVAMFRAAEAVGGMAGSGLFTLALRPDPIPVFTVGPVTYTARNEHLICALRGHPIVSVWSENVDVPHPPGRWTAEAFGSGFTADPQRDLAFLADHLSQL